jgi:hypothetical protein
MRDEIRPLFTDAIRFWEKARILFNITLAGVSIGTLFLLFGDFGRVFRYLGQQGLLIFILAFLGNIAYCSAYPIDTLVQLSDYQKGWRKGRWILWLMGTAFACAITVASLIGLPKLFA